MASIVAAKRALRKNMRRILASLTAEQKQRQSDIVTAKLLASPEYRNSQRVAVFVSLPDEVCTQDIIRDVLATQRECFVPRCEVTSSYMEMVRVHSLEDIAGLPTSSLKTREPLPSEKREEALSTGGLDLVLVPGLAFTVRGHRMGRGKGYYDLYLTRIFSAQVTPPATVALAFHEQVLPSLPTDPHDFQVDTVLYPEKA